MARWAIFAGDDMFDLLSKNQMVTTMDKAMTVASRRAGLVASNMANIDTPGYRTRDFPFHEVLKDVLCDKQGQQLPMTRTHPWHFHGQGCQTQPMARTHPRHFNGQGSETLPYALDKAVVSWERNDGNDVNLDKENMKLMQTQGVYTQAALFTQTAIRRVLNAIRDGGK
jgi:flagellar basal-body rod protein FlgB